MNGDKPRTDAPFGAAENDLGQQEGKPGDLSTTETPPFTSPVTDAQPDTATKIGAGRSLWVLLRRLVAKPAESPSAADAKRPQPDHLKDCLALLDANPGLRSTTIRILGPPAAEEGVSLTHEHIETEDEHGNARQTDLYIAYSCSNNHWIDQNVRILGTCFCGAILCSTPGCFAVCAACSACCCSQHRKSYIDDGQVITFCSRCFWKKYWFW